jgi:hypothetical protein
VSLAEKFKSVEPSQTGMPCGMAKLIESMSKVDKETLEKVLFDSPNETPRISNTKIYQILSEEGYSVAPFAIAQHRRKQCRCFVGLNPKNKETK